jgi:aryl-alcohol dehydrogenase-like predicted oxidoreductase
MPQLKENIDTESVDLAPEALEEIDRIHLLYPNPAI